MCPCDLVYDVCCAALICRRPAPPTITKVTASGPGSAIAATVWPPAMTGGSQVNLTFFLSGVPVAGGANLTRTATGFTPTQAWRDCYCSRRCCASPVAAATRATRVTVVSPAGLCAEAIFLPIESIRARSFVCFLRVCSHHGWMEERRQQAVPLHCASQVRGCCNQSAWPASFLVAPTGGLACCGLYPTLPAPICAGGAASQARPRLLASPTPATQ